jgi:hypothetical protein
MLGSNPALKKVVIEEEYPSTCHREIFGDPNREEICE